MNFYIKQITYIILISISFSIIRYFLIEGEYPLIKRSDISTTTYASDSNLDSLKKYLYDITYPEIIEMQAYFQTLENFTYVCSIPVKM